MDSLSQQLLEYIGREGYKPQRIKTLAKNLGITKKRWDGFQATIDQLQSEKKIRLSDGGRVQLPAPTGSITGIVRKIASGAAFVIPHDKRTDDREGDIFVEQHDLKDAQNGDEVVVRITNKRRTGGGRCGF
ncbi:MAG: hypothetical protein ACK5Q5_16475, partial [Planctomycetaceae bacterium]